jgi:hypothetical protein
MDRITNCRERRWNAWIHTAVLLIPPELAGEGEMNLRARASEPNQEEKPRGRRESELTRVFGRRSERPSAPQIGGNLSKPDPERRKPEECEQRLGRGGEALGSAGSLAGWVGSGGLGEVLG